MRANKFSTDPQEDAVPFMEDLGFMMDPGSHRADFLTGVTVPTERLIAPGCEDKFPRTGRDILAAEREEAAANTAVFKEMVSREEHWGVPDASSITVDFFTQVKVAVMRQYQLMWGYKPTLLMKQGATVIHALLGGSPFYSAPNNSVGLFLKGAKHRSFGLYHSAAICAQIAADFPILLFQVTYFGLVLYFMVGLKTMAGTFFTYLITNFMTSMWMARWRCIPYFDAATKPSGLSIFIWMFWINPMACGFEALLGNEFHGRDIFCYGPNMILSGPGYIDGEGGQSCAGVIGAEPGEAGLTGDAYLAAMSFMAYGV
ncbi:hypothetical protein BDV23DRAFT_182828 [Aspergillus alliaceus]|uniref:ABC-2 type transporter transmembrane domain-containing protein n=1 Tax=Petromyces alliaceus TaxID=209559 RepID=A0A5N7CB09_PETAA|nr:hypothetical protein BDV23DRAFT_182828 [Aspergillus alliaceus]